MWWCWVYIIHAFVWNLLRAKGVGCGTDLCLGYYTLPDAIPANLLQMEDASFLLHLIITPTRQVCAGVLWLLTEELCLL